jgi:hypothetical protein
MASFKGWVVKGNPFVCSSFIVRDAQPVSDNRKVVRMAGFGTPLNASEEDKVCQIKQMMSIGNENDQVK